MENQDSSRKIKISSKVRIVARIQDVPDQESRFCNGDSKPVLSVQKPGRLSEKFTISFGGDQPTSRKDAYEVDYCYEPNEDIGLIYSREINPQISRVFDGRKATFIAFGARGSGKTYTIQGSEEKSGLAMLSMAEILPMAEERKNLVAVSFYEVFQDHVYDLLDAKRPEVQVLEDAQGKITLKGLSQVPVKSISEFQKLYCTESSSLKLTQKTALELPRRSHKGLMIHILACDENSSTKLVGKMNFVDLTGYENARRNSIDGPNLIESTRINKSLNALLNVIHALNANESRVPYRESKLTRVLQDSLGGTNYVLMLTCLKPLFCQDTIHAMSLASRSCQVIKAMTVSSQKNGKPVVVCPTTKNLTSSRLPLSAKKANSVVKGRKLFIDGNQPVSSKQAKCPSDKVLAKLEISDPATAIAPSSHEEVKCTSDNVFAKPENLDPASTIAPSSQEKEVSISEIPLVTTPQDEVSISSALLEAESFTMAGKDVSPNRKIHNIEVTPGISSETKALTVVKGGSPPLSTRLRELSNNLKALCSTTPLSINRPQDVHTPYSGQLVGFVDNLEPKTPVVSTDVSANDKRGTGKFNSTLQTFSQRSSGMKQSLVQEYLQFLNTASKEDLKELKGIGEKRATSILELREVSPEPFKSLDDLQDIGLSAKQVKHMMKTVAVGLFN